MDAQGLSALQLHAAPMATGKPENRSVDVRDVEEREIGAAEAESERETETAAAEAEPPGSEDAEARAELEARAQQETQDAEAHPAEACERETNQQQEHALETEVAESSLEDDETQLAAIRELMTRASARGIWLSLGEIAEATEFAEASISAQLRHLRKAHHGGHRVEKRRRGWARAVARRRIRDARKGPVVWEYRVLPK